MFGFSAEPQAVTATRNNGKARQKKARFRQELVDPVYDYSHITRPRREVPIDDYLVERVDDKQTKNVESQTSAFIDVPYDQDRKPVKVGRDSATQTEVDIVFHFDTEVEPLVELIVCKTLEQSVQEVHEEDEIAALGQARTELAQRKQKDDDEVQECEEKAKALQSHLAELRARENMRVEAEAEELSERTLEAILHDMLEYVKDESMDVLDTEGYFPDAHRAAAEFVFLPWLIEQVDARVRDTQLVHDLVADIARRVIDQQKFSLA